MADAAIQVGDRVINLQVPGIFTVIAVEGALVVIEEPGRGIRMRVRATSVRRVDTA